MRKRGANGQFSVTALGGICVYNPRDNIPISINLLRGRSLVAKCKTCGEKRMELTFAIKLDPS